MLAVVLLFVRFLADPLTERLARVPELLVGFSIALAAFFAAVGDGLGFGKELGGLLAGVALASTPYRDAIAARLAPLRDFLLLFFFIALGSQLDVANLGESWFAAGVLSLFVLIGNPLIVIAIMGFMGYRLRTGFLAGLTVAQISEFSLIFMAMGVTIGHVNAEALGLVTLVGLVTIALSTYMITYSHQLFAWCEPLIGFMAGSGRREAPEAQIDPAGAYDVIIFGLGRYGGTLGRLMSRRGFRVLGVDFSPAAVRQCRGEGLDTVYGDASDPEFIPNLPLGSVAWIVSTIRDPNTGVIHSDTHRVLVQALRENGFRGKVAVTSGVDPQAALALADTVDLVLDPFQDAADRAAELLTSGVRPHRLQIIEPDEQKPIGG